MNSSMNIRDQVGKFFWWLGSAAKICGIYGHEHRITKETIDRLYAIADDLLSKRKEITIGIIGKEIVFEKYPFYEISLRRKSFVDYLKEIKINKMTYLSGLGKKELTEFIRILSMTSEKMNKAGGVFKVFGSLNIRHISIGGLGIAIGEDIQLPIEDNIEDIEEIEDIDAVTKKQFQENVDFLKKTFKDIKGNESLDIESARHIVTGLVNNLIKNKNLLLMLTSIRLQDEDKYIHNLNTAIFTLLQTEILGLDQKYYNDVAMASLLHNIGALTFPEDDMDERDQLTSEEEQRRFLKDVKGAKILLEAEISNALAPIVAFEHNIRYDSSGPMKKFYGDELNLISMMISISNHYNKLRKEPKYYEIGGPEKVYEDMMKLSGKKFHPDLLNNFFSAIGVYPPGTLVELDNNEIGLVIQESALDIRRPQVEILYDNEGNKLEEPYIINLLEKDNRGQYKRTIIRSMSPLDKFQIPEKYY